MSGFGEAHGTAAIRRAHLGSNARIRPRGDRPAIAPYAEPFDREQREHLEHAYMAPLATRANGGGDRHVPEPPDPLRTCFERDRDRILHATAFRRLAGKTQVFLFPEDHQRTRLTHALEVAQVASGIARALRLNVVLTEAIALAHDCGHGPGGHASEDAFTPFVTGGYDHAQWGADVTLTELNLCAETLDGVRNHSWSRPAPSTPEGEVVSWADRIAYVCHDFEDAVSSGVVRADDLPPLVQEVCGQTRRLQIGTFIRGVVEASTATGDLGMAEGTAAALESFREFNYERIYLRPESIEQARSVIRLLTALVEHFSPAMGAFDAVSYVSGMTDRYACKVAMSTLGFSLRDLPRGLEGTPS